MAKNEDSDGENILGEKVTRPKHLLEEEAVSESPKGDMAEVEEENEKENPEAMEEEQDAKQGPESRKVRLVFSCHTLLSHLRRR